MHHEFGMTMWDYQASLDVFSGIGILALCWVVYEHRTVERAIRVAIEELADA